jgi:hypothetical protein
VSTANRNALKAAGYTALWTFLGLFATSLLGWLQDITAWASDDGGMVAFPDPSVLVKAAVAAAAAAISGVTSAIVRLVQANSSVPGHPPTY